MDVVFVGYQCLRCNHKWVPITYKSEVTPKHKPKICPHCKSKYWETPRPVKKGTVSQ